MFGSVHPCTLLVHLGGVYIRFAGKTLFFRCSGVPGRVYKDLVHLACTPGGVGCTCSGVQTLKCGFSLLRRTTWGPPARGSLRPPVPSALCRRSSSTSRPRRPP